ncbi:hypothetical protein PUN28_019279 [Cardiocondyla obscurior]|uniref:Zn(2)-C6 fungal-type domain-containing protein n=1 Tax=Cardiocondyla obscurior TaxID=286306 RepID=A0AAW2EEV5_9HYME
MELLNNEISFQRERDRERPKGRRGCGNCQRSSLPCSVPKLNAQCAKTITPSYRCHDLRLLTSNPAL